MEDEEKAIDEALNGGPRAESFDEMLAALLQYIEYVDLDISRAEDDAQRKPLLAKRRQFERDIERLRQERAVAEFVENSVRAASRRAKLDLEQD